MSTVLLEGAEPAGQPEGDNRPPPKQQSPFKAVSDALDADVFVYTGSITRKLANAFTHEVEKAGKKPNVALVLCTTGGDPDAAYIVARILKARYKDGKFTLLVFGICKSAGTLIALGADEIVMSSRGELGPLDVQMMKSDELVFRSSGLDISQAIESLSERAYDVFWKNFMTTIVRTGGAITTKTAADIATSLSVGLLSPITQQIDPLRVGEVERAINIAQHYGERLNGDAKRVQSLINDYPSHTFVIDYTEACDLFGNVRQPNEVEKGLENYLRQLEKVKGVTFISHPNDEGIVGYIAPPTEAEHEQEHAEEHAGAESADTNGHGPPVESNEGEPHRGTDKAGDVRADEAAQPAHRADGQGQQPSV